MDDQKKYVAYYRVSTTKQGSKGLGIAAQKAIVKHFAELDNAQIVQVFEEVGSGKNMEGRLELQKALKECEQSKSTLIVAKLDRLSRDVEHIFQLKKQLGEQLVCCDLPQTDSLTLSIFAGLAQRERELISIRTKAALKAKKERGEELGTIQNLTDKGRAMGRKTLQLNAQNNPNTKRAVQLILAYRKMGHTFQHIANKLNTNAFKTAKNKNFGANTVKYLYDKYKT